MTRLAPATPLRDVAERDWDAQLFASKKGVATMLGWTLVYHTLRSKGSTSGFPDRVLVRDRIVYSELKREGEKPTERQRTWLDGLARAGGEVYVWLPSDLEEVGRVLAPRCMFLPGSGGSRPCLAPRGHPAWTPGSLWIAGVGRADTVPA